MRKAIIENGVVINVIVADEAFELGISCGDEVNVGWEYGNGGFIAPTFEPMPQPTIEEIKAQIKSQRQSAYRDRSDPIYMKWQRGEATEQEWLNEVDAIKTEFPYPEEVSA